MIFKDTKKILPIDVVFHPNWWHKNYGIVFNKNFFFEPETRVENDRKMRNYLFERFPDLGLGEKQADLRPVVGGTLLAAGYIISGILGCEIRYSEDASPEVIPANLTDEDIQHLKSPNILDTPIMKEAMKLFDSLEKRFGYLEGDINWEGIQNVGMNLRGQQLFLDYFLNPPLVRKLFDHITTAIIQFLEIMDARTGTTSLSVNRIVRHVDPRIHLHSDCTVTMISADLYKEFILPYEQMLSEKFAPYGIHYCGNDMHKVRHEFAKLEKATFFDVGWGSDVKLCREALPDKFLSLRLSPMRMSSRSPDEIQKDIEGLLNGIGSLQNVGLCCVNMDFHTPDENIRKIFETAQVYRKRYCKGRL